MSIPDQTESRAEAAPADYHALEGPIMATFYRYLIPSLVGILAITSASLIDGIFIGNYVGVSALAAVNLLIPIMALLFGVGLMVSVGGSVRAGKYLGEKNTLAASNIFSKTLIFVGGYGVVVITLLMIFERALFNFVGADESLFPLMSEYFSIILPFLLAQLLLIVLYFFIRLDGFPALTATALVMGSVINIGLDYLFIVEYQWGLAGAAWATGISQLIPLLVLLCYFLVKKRKLHFFPRQQNWYEVVQAAYNGISEFINETSSGVIAFILNWLLIQRAGVDGVAAITVVNYLLMIGFMVYFSIADTAQVMISQNFGAQNPERMLRFVKIALINIAVISGLCIYALVGFTEPLILLFLMDEGSHQTLGLAKDFIGYVWPIFIFAGINMLISGYLTAIHQAFPSGMVAVCRTLILPAILLLSLNLVFSQYQFVVALAMAEALTFVLAFYYFLKLHPEKSLLDNNTPITLAGIK